MLVAGNVIVGRKDEGVLPSSEEEAVVHGVEEQEEGTDEVVELDPVKDEDLVDLGDALETRA